MKTKIVVLLLAAVIFPTDAVEVTDEDIDSPLVSYLLAKLNYNNDHGSTKYQDQ